MPALHNCRASEHSRKSAMSGMIAAALTPTNDSDMPVKVNIEPSTAGTAPGTASLDTASLESKGEQTRLHGNLPLSADLVDLAVPSRVKIQGSPAAAAVQQQLLTAEDSLSPAPAAAVSIESQNMSAPVAEAADDNKNTHTTSDTDCIRGSPAAELMQETKDDAAAGYQHGTAGVHLDTTQGAGEGNQGSFTGSPLDGEGNSSAEQATGDSSYERAAGAATTPAADSYNSSLTPVAKMRDEAAAPATAHQTEGASEGAETGVGPAAVYPGASAGTRHLPSSGTLAGRSALLVAAKPSALLSEIALSLVQHGARVTVAVKHVQDGHMYAKKLQKQLSLKAQQLLNSTACSVNFASQASIRQFASAINASDEPLDMLLLHTVEAAAAGRRWYTPEGTAGTAQVGFLGPATLLRLLEPKLSACCTSVLLTTSPLHRLGHLDDCEYMMTSWAGASVPDTQLALLAYARQLAQHMQGQGLSVAAVDVGPVREQPLAGSLLRKLPPLHQVLPLLLPSAHDTAQLLASVAEDMLAKKGHSAAESAGTGTAGRQEVLGGQPAPNMPNNLSVSLAADGAATTEAVDGAQPGSQGDGMGADTEAAAGQEPAGVSSTGAVFDSASASMGAQDEGATEPAGVALPPADTEGESAAYEAGEALGADIKLLEMLMQQEGEPAATSATAEAGKGADAAGMAGKPQEVSPAGGQQQHGEAATDSAEAGVTAPGDKELAAGSSRFAAEAPAGALEDSYVGVADAEQQEHQGMSAEQREVVEGGAAASAAASEATSSAAAGAAYKNFRYLSRGLLATPLLTSLDHAGRGSWLTHVLSSLTSPFYQLSAGSIVRGSMLLDWPVRAWLLAPAGAVSGWGKTLLGRRAASLLSQLQRGVPGVEGVPQGSAPQWVEVTPAGLVMDGRLGVDLWQLVEESARVY